MEEVTKTTHNPPQSPAAYPAAPGVAPASGLQAEGGG
jgi:hypothetical protein